MALQALLAGAIVGAHAQALDALPQASADAIQSDAGLTQDEADQLYDSAGHIHRQLMLLITFADKRLSTVDKLCAEAPSAADAAKIRTLIAQFSIIVDRADDGLDQYQGQVHDQAGRNDMRAGLEELTAAFARFSQELQPAQAAESSPTWREYAPVFRSSLEDAEDTLRSSLGVAQAYLQDDRPID
jgi:hypothetical protein